MVDDPIDRLIIRNKGDDLGRKLTRKADDHLGFAYPGREAGPAHSQKMLLKD